MRPKPRKGFLLNHLIHELLPPKGDGLRWSNSDPVTGQAAWYDLRVRVERTENPLPASSAGHRHTEITRRARPGNCSVSVRSKSHDNFT